MISEKEFMTCWNDSKAGLKNFALKHTSNNVNDAENLLHDTFINAFKNREKFDVTTSFKTWVYNVLKNKFIDDYRKKKIRSNINNFIGENESDFKITSCSLNVGDQKIFEEDFNSAIAKLDSRIRIPFLMFIEGYKYDEIAEKCDSPLGTIKVRIHNARKALQELLRDYRPDNFIREKEIAIEIA